MTKIVCVRQLCDKAVCERFCDKVACDKVVSVCVCVKDRVCV